MDPADRSAQELRARHDRDESNYCQRFDRSKYRLVSATGSSSQQEADDFGTSLRRRGHGHGRMFSSALLP